MIAPAFMKELRGWRIGSELELPPTGFLAENLGAGSASGYDGRGVSTSLRSRTTAWSLLAGKAGGSCNTSEEE